MKKERKKSEHQHLNTHQAYEQTTVILDKLDHWLDRIAFYQDESYWRKDKVVDQINWLKKQVKHMRSSL